MLNINFAGYFQVRLPTDPDPTDEKRGVSGYSFALAGEPDLDRIIRLHNPVALRSHSPDIGVFVTYVANGNDIIANHPLVGAKVNLLGDAKFEMLNYVLTLNAGTESIFPFELEIEGGGVSIKRTDYLNPEKPGDSLYNMTLEQLRRRGGALGPLLNEGVFHEIRQCKTPTEFRLKRLAALQEDLANATDEIEIAGLKTRIREIQWPNADNIDWNNRRTMSLRFVERRNFEINGPSEISDPHNKLGLTLDPGVNWPIDFWNGSWDCDTLTGYMRGTLQIPVKLQA